MTGESKIGMSLYCKQYHERQISPHRGGRVKRNQRTRREACNLINGKNGRDKTKQVKKGSQKVFLAKTYCS